MRYICNSIRIYDVCLGQRSNDNRFQFMHNKVCRWAEKRTQSDYWCTQHLTDPLHIISFRHWKSTVHNLFSFEFPFADVLRSLFLLCFICVFSFIFPTTFDSFSLWLYWFVQEFCFFVLLCIVCNLCLILPRITSMYPQQDALFYAGRSCYSQKFM